MFYILSKTVYYLAMPYTWITIALVMAHFWRNRPNRRRWCVIIAVGLFFITSNRFLANEALRAWEWDPMPINEVPNTQVAVLLGGMTNQDMELNDRVFFAGNEDRLIQTAHLYFIGKVEQILITGGTGRIMMDSAITPEAILLQNTLLDWGVPKEDIILETESFNTYENAVFTAAILDSLGITSTPILVTSAFHMRRSVGCFQKAGLEVIPYPADFETIDYITRYPAYFFIPQEEAPAMWRRIIKEMVGYTAYKVTGYL